ncbi:MAG: hypothetical protein IIA07_01115 [Proteobacteria bacterium]|nr:hypothetical protein [Pseudomonadota bacterium]
MFIKSFENALALAGALLVLLAVSSASRTAFADEAAAADSTLISVQTAATISLAAAESANRDAADEALNSIAHDNQPDLDLDFHLLDRKSILVARSR